MPPSCPHFSILYPSLSCSVPLPAAMQDRDRERKITFNEEEMALQVRPPLFLFMPGSWLLCSATLLRWIATAGQRGQGAGDAVRPPGDSQAAALSAEELAAGRGPVDAVGPPRGRYGLDRALAAAAGPIGAAAPRCRGSARSAALRPPVTLGPPILVLLLLSWRLCNPP